MSTEIVLISAAERHQILGEWNNTQTDYPHDKRIHQLFEAAVEQNPDAIAIIVENTQITYRELNQRSNQLAHYLKNLGVKSEMPVGIYIDRSLEMVVAMLGILKAGGAYLPIDPTYPQERITYILSDSCCKIILTEKKILAFLPKYQGQLICIDADWPEISQQSQLNTENSATSENLAYIIYTSGSTGKPKGVQICHQSLVNFLNSTRSQPGLTESDIVLAVTTICFDIAALEIYLPLIVGAKIVLASREVAANGDLLLSKLINCGATILQATPATWRLLLAAGWQRSPRLKMLCGGEALPRELADRLLEKGGSLWNMYGPTETTVWSTICHINALEDRHCRKNISESIGRPIANTEIYILDDNLQPVSIGDAGELYIGGVGVARGYWNRPELTAEKFIANPFSVHPGTRLYKTGDLARYLPDGNIEYLGRLDSQVKIRGFRIELAEIETALNSHSQVRESVVIAREDIPGNKRLVAYFVSDREPAPTISELRRFLKEKLPEYMLPSAFVKLERLPLTPNNKIDRRSLPAPEWRSDNSPNFIAPRSPLEEMLAQMWAEVFSVERVGVEDNFFEMGGHSLLATQLVSRVRANLKVELSLRSLFENPTVASLAECIQKQQEQLLSVPPLLPVARSSELPLSFAQQRLWFLDRLHPNSAFYNIPTALRLSGNLNINALENSLNEIIRRHEILRTNFTIVEEKAVQFIAANRYLTLSVVDLQSLPDGDRETEMHRLAASVAAKNFNLENDCLLRATLFQLSEVETVLLLVVHHIICDAWSTGILMQELAAFYEAFCAGIADSQSAPLLLELPLQYADFTIWQQQWLTAEILDAELAYWKQQLAGAPALLELPTDRPRSASQSYRGARQYCIISSEINQAIAELSKQQSATLFMTLLAAFVTLLYCLSRQSDICIGTPIANRNRVEIEGAIGFFANTLVLRTEISGNPSFAELLSQIREVALGAYAHQNVPFERVVEALQPERSLSHAPLFQVMFVFQNALFSTRTLPGLTASPIEVETGTSKFDITLSIEENSTGLVAAWEYNTDLFDGTTIAQIIEHFQTLLEGIVANPEQKLSDLPLLSATSRQKLLKEWNNTESAYDLSVCAHQLFEASVEQHPDAIAVVFEDHEITYAELNRRANKIARYLQSLGVKPEILVGICLERSPEMLIGLLGILKAGCAYLPLDINYPKERLAFMLEDASVSILITQNHPLEKLPKQQAQVICLDSDWEIIDRQSEENPTSYVKSDNLAYVIYTSGSTGKPKGVAMSHRSLSNLIFWHLESSTFSRSAKTLQFAPISFDVSFQEIFSTWCSGGTLILISEAVRRDAVALWRFLEKQAIERLFIPFVALQQLAEVAENLEIVPTSLRDIIIAGEQLQITRQIANLFIKLKNCRLHNHYGPSESHVVTAFTLTGEANNWSALPAIGRPISNVQIYLLDNQLQPVPIGVCGKLYIGGVAVARGYLGRPETTAEKFIPDPFSQVPGAYLYKTGDLARYSIDGNIEYLGRIDNQVKIRGFRIELAEIETALNSHPQVREAVVIAREDIPGNKRLVAYFVSDREPAPTISELRRFLKEKLPEYMLPSAFARLDALPLTPSGKVDRRSLPAPSTDLEKIFVAPRNPIEEMLANIWAEVMRSPQIGIRDNFFELGGHSLLATQVISRLRKNFGVELPLQSIFEYPTIAELAELIQSSLRAEQKLEIPAIFAVSLDANLPLSFAQQRLWFLDQLQPNSSVYNVPAAFRLTGSLNVQAIELSLNEILRRHECLRTNFDKIDGQPCQIIAAKVILNLPIIDLSQLTEIERNVKAQQLALEEAQQPFNLASDPLLRVQLLRLDIEEYLLLVTMHHIVSDGWSFGVFVSELTALYKAFNLGEASPLPELPVQYKDFALWQRQWFSGEVLESQLAYWKQQLGGNLPVLDLPTDRTRPAVQTFRGSELAFKLPQNLSQELKALSQRQGVTLFMTLLAAFKTLLYRYTGQEDILVGSAIAGRNRAEIEALIGFFVNTLVLRSDLSGNPRFLDLLNRVRQVALNAYARQDLPFEKLVEELQPDRSLSQNPLFQVMFVLQNTPANTWDLPGLTLDWSYLSNGTAKFDLTVQLQETNSGINGWLEYNTDLFEAETMQRLAGHYQTLLEGIVIAPDRHLSELPLLTLQERHQLLFQWNNTQINYRENACVHELFEAQVEKTPDAVAVVFESEQLTYKELNARANQLAGYLRSIDIKADSPVGICVERSLLMAVGVLGTFKAGGAYVPLDPAYPKERLAFMLSDTCVPVLLTQQKLVDRLPETKARIICLDSDWDTIAQFSQENQPNIATSDNLAYIIYTSGSTGRPKGICLAHRPLVNLLKWHYLSLYNSARTLQFASFSFDASFHEMFAAWGTGGTLFIIPDSLRINAADLGEFLAEYAIEKVILPVVILQQLADLVGDRNPAALHPELFKNLREITTTGEQLQITPAIVNLFKSLPHCSFHNHYGPSETHVVTAFAQRVRSTLAFQQKPDDWSFYPPIGIPIANTQIYLVDKYFNLVPVGVPGELYIGGVSLARGYLNRPDLTAEKFISDPFSKEPGARLYKTGDLARYLPDGNIEYLGRIDNQVKIRGFRIELGEIESLLNSHPELLSATVIVREDVPGDKRLVAYFVPKQEIAPHISDLRRFLKEQLPEYMLPSAFVKLDRLPLTPNGKVDRRGLPAPREIVSALQNNFVAPRDILELQLAQIWEKVLNINAVGVKDNFFDLGGHSLLVVSLLTQIEKQFAQTLPLTAFFQAATIEQLAGILRQETFAHWSPLVEIQPKGFKPPFFCVHPIGGNVICYYELARYLGSDRPFYGLQARGLDGQQQPVNTIEDMAASYVEAVRTVQPNGPYLLGGWSMGGVVAFEMAIQLQKQGHEVALLALLDSWAPEGSDRLMDDNFDALALVNKFSRDLGSLFGKDFSILPETSELVNEEERLNNILERAKIAGFIPADIELMQFRHLLEVFQANLKALSRYIPEIYSNRITLFQASELLSEYSSAPVCLGWQKLTTEPVENYPISGNHYTIMTKPGVEYLAEQLRRCLEVRSRR